MMRQQREIKTYQAVNLLDQGIEDAEMEWSIEFQDTGRKIYILTISATASLTNGFRYIKELLMQHHNFYLKSVMINWSLRVWRSLASRRMR